MSGGWWAQSPGSAGGSAGRSAGQGRAVSWLTSQPGQQNAKADAQAAAKEDREGGSYQAKRVARLAWRNRWWTVPVTAAFLSWVCLVVAVVFSSAPWWAWTAAVTGSLTAGGWVGVCRFHEPWWQERRTRRLELAFRHRWEDACRDLGILSPEGRVLSRGGLPPQIVQQRKHIRRELREPAVKLVDGTVDATLHLPLRLQPNMVVNTDAQLHDVLAGNLFLPSKLGIPEFTQVWQKPVNGVRWWGVRCEYRRAPGVGELDHWGFRPAPDDFSLRLGAGPQGENIVDLLASPHTRVYGPPRALALDTPIATLTGWTTMGDIRPGDVVFDDQGQPTVVTGVSEVFEGRPCYEVAFDDGSTIVADGEHRWLTWTRDSRLGDKRAASRRARHGRPPRVSRRRPGAHPPKVRTTDEIASSLLSEGRNNHSIPVAAALDLPDVDLPIDPYLLGVWLGDGLSGHAMFVGMDPEIAEYVRDAGYEVTERPHHGRASRWGVTRRTPWRDAVAEAAALVSGGVCLRHAAMRSGLGSESLISILRRRGHERTATWNCRDTDGHVGQGVHECVHRSSAYPPRVYQGDGFYRELMTAGLLGNKHIPVAYLRASFKQRLALLQGIMDTDGSCGRERGGMELGLSDLRLITQVRELVVSLGHKPGSIGSRDTKLGGTAYRFTWMAPDLVFRLPRKAELQKLGGFKPYVTTHRYIRDVRPTASVPTRCITVASPSHLFLAGRTMIPTHNSGKGLVGMDAAAQGCARGWLVLIVNCSGAPEWDPWAAANLPNVQVIKCSLRDSIAGAVAVQNGLNSLLTIAEVRDRVCSQHGAHGWHQLDPAVRVAHPRVLVVIDEPSSLLKNAGQAGKIAGGLLEMVARTGPKYAITVMTLDQIINVTSSAVSGPTLEVMRYVVWMGDQPDASTRSRVGGFVGWPPSPPGKGGAVAFNFGTPASSKQDRMPNHSPAELRRFLADQAALWIP